jgi:hypothetical protein
LAQDLAAENEKLPDDEEKTIMNQHIRFVKASEPTDIIWENRHHTKKDYVVREAKALTGVGLLLAGCFYITYVIAFKAAQVQVVFPARDCTAITTPYGSYLEEYAAADYDYINANRGVVSTGCLQCFCDAELLSNPDAATTNYNNGTIPICGKYQALITKVNFWTNALSYIIIGLNYFLREACIAMIAWIGYRTETEKLEKTTMLTFYVVFLNTAVLLLLVNANMLE